MSTPLRVAVGAVGVLFTIQALAWLAMPERAAGDLGMPLLEGMARSTQVGDFTAFFATTALLVWGGLLRRKKEWLQAAALLLGSAALFRTLAWAVHGADFAAQFIGVEIATAAVLLFAASRTTTAS